MFKIFAKSFLEVLLSPLRAKEKKLRHSYLSLFLISQMLR